MSNNAIDKRSLFSVLISAAWKRLRIMYLKLRFNRVHFGKACDIRLGFHFQMGPKGSLEIGDHCILDHDMTIECNGSIKIGKGTIFGHHCTLAAKDSLEIGEDCLIAEMVSIRDHNHCFDSLDIPVREQGSKSAPVNIGRNVWLGSKVTVTKGVRIGDNVVIGANAVVTKDIPLNTVAVGVPARAIRSR